VNTNHPIFSDVVKSAKLKNGLVRLQLAAWNSNESDERESLRDVCELVMPLEGITSLANLIAQITADLEEKGVLSRKAPQISPAKLDS
jgi:hypothetical protein